MTPAPKATLADSLNIAGDWLCRLTRLAADDRRPHSATEQLLDDIDALGRELRRLARG